MRLEPGTTPFTWARLCSQETNPWIVFVSANLNWLDFIRGYIWGHLNPLKWDHTSPNILLNPTNQTSFYTSCLTNSCPSHLSLQLSYLGTALIIFHLTIGICYLIAMHLLLELAPFHLICILNRWPRHLLRIQIKWKGANFNNKWTTVK